MLQKQINEKYQQIHEFIDLLKKTDYHVVKHSDPSAEPYEVPAEIAEARRNARAKINRLENDIANLEEELRDYVETIDGIEL